MVNQHKNSSGLKKLRMLVGADFEVDNYQDAANAEQFCTELEALVSEYYDCSQTSSLVRERRGDRLIDLSRMSFRINKNKEEKICPVKYALTST